MKLMYKIILLPLSYQFVA